MYIYLTHGRKDPVEHMEEFGPPGPAFGPYPHFHFVYGNNILFGDGNILMYEGDCIHYDGMYYGDSFVVSDEFAHQNLYGVIEEFSQSKAGPPEESTIRFPH